MAETKNSKANRPKSGTSGDGGGGGGGSGGPRVRYQLPPDEASPRGSPDPAGTSYQKQPWTLKKFNLYGDMPEYNDKWSMFLGFIQIGLGAVCFILGIVLIAINAAGSHSGVGIWGGLVFIASGLVGFFSYKKPLTPLVIACFGLCLASVVIAFIKFILLCYFTNADNVKLAEYNRNIPFFGYTKENNPKFFEARDAQTPKIAVGVVLILFTLAELAAACLQGLLAGKVFLVRGPQAVQADSSNRHSASNPVPAGEAATGGDQSWGEYNPPARNQPAGDQSWGEYNPPARNKQPKKQDRDSRPEPRGSGEPQEPDPEWTEYKPQKGRKAMREESQKGNQPKPRAPPSSEVELGTQGHVTYNPSEKEPHGNSSVPAVGGIIRRQATGDVDIEEDTYCPPPRSSYMEEENDYDVPPPAVSTEI
ncbi:uncharacterized protein LOC135502402 isoform X1 [Lineus longissimus]|uniref:uncharacterized protein LOC135502402 isoform X1 n=1 Tax=Lineus longissimus TaxID=88925 RepID=UPI002B4ECD6D